MYACVKLCMYVCVCMYVYTCNIGNALRQIYKSINYIVVKDNFISVLSYGVYIYTHA